MTIFIREYKHPEDYLEVRILWESIEKGVHLGISDSPDGIRLKVQYNPGLFLLAIENQKIIGTVMGGFDGRRGLLYHLAVAASHRRQGVGSQLMQEIENRLRNLGCHKCYLMVIEENSRVLDYYGKRGWALMDKVHLLGKEFL